MLRTLTLAMTILFVTAMAAQAATVRAVVDRNQTTVGESISLQVIVEGGDGDVDLSGITDFKVVSQSSASNFQMINGRTSRQMIYTYDLVPLGAGHLTIPAIPVTIDGKVHYTAPIGIRVSREPPADSGQRDVYVTAEVSKSDPWVGQQLIYTFHLFNAVQIADAKFQAPEFEGFHAEELQDRQSRRTIVNGREFIVTDVTYILVPAKSGHLTIESAVLQVGLLQRSRRPSPFAGMDAFFGRGEMTTRVLQSDPITVTVRDLPDRPSGVNFSGLVGRFDIQAKLDKRDLQTGDSATLTVTISGTGNIMDAAPPAIPVPADFKSYADNPEESIQKGANGYSGSKTFRTALVPVQAGKFRVKPITLSYFDTKAGTYRIVATPAMDIHVTPSATGTTDIDVARAPATQPPSLKKRVEFTGRDILPLKTGLEVLQPRKAMAAWVFALLLALPILGFLITRTTLGRLRKGESPEQIMAERARQALKSATAIDASDTEFLSALYRALVSAILGRQGSMGTSLTWSEAHARLVAIGWDEVDANAAAQLLETVESFNYSGGKLDRDKRSDLLERTRQVVRRLAR